jgi:hypothetical protein
MAPCGSFMTLSISGCAGYTWGHWLASQDWSLELGAEGHAGKVRKACREEDSARTRERGCEKVLGHEGNWCRGKTEAWGDG